MVASIGKIISPLQGVAYFERDGYYARDGPAHREASAWAGKGAEALGLTGPVDAETFTAILEGKVPGTSQQLGRKDRDGNIHRRPGRYVTLSAPKSVSLAARVGGDWRMVDAHELAHVGQQPLDHLGPIRPPAACIDGIAERPHHARSIWPIETHVEAVLGFG